MQIFVINLEKDVARRESISTQLDEQGLDFEIVSGVYGAGLTAQARDELYDDRKAKLNRARSLVPAEIGCALSHLKVYRTMVERGIDAALILEDDVFLPPALKDVLNGFARHIDAGMPSVWLLSPAVGDAAAADAIQFDSLHRLLPYRSGYYTSSYLLTRAAASALLRELAPVSDVADCWQRLARYKVVDLYVVSPPLIEQKQDQFGSSTTDDYHAKASPALFARALYKVRRARSIVWSLIYAPYRRWFRPYAGLKINPKH